MEKIRDAGRVQGTIGDTSAVQRYWGSWSDEVSIITT